MSETVRSLSEAYHVPVSKSVDALLEKAGIIVLSADIEIPEHSLPVYEEIIKKMAPRKPIPPPPPPILPFQLLERDYIIFTYVALRKSATASVLAKIIGMKKNGKTNAQIVLCKEAMEQIERAAQTNESLRARARNLRALQEYRMLTILSGRISEENHAISKFIKEKKISATILIVGFNRSLDSFVFFRNKRYERNSEYTKIMQVDINGKGELVLPNRHNPAFPNPQRKPCSNLSTYSNITEDEIPHLGDNAYYNQNGSLVPVVLESVIGEGAEAIVYRIFDGKKCAKVFKEHSNTPMKMKKISLMCSKRSHMENIDAPVMERIAWPEKMLYNSAGKPVGYIMKFFNEASCTSVFGETHSLSEYTHINFPKLIPNVQKSHQVTMAVTFTELIDFLHHNNIILCDINRENILFDDNQTAYIIDLDSAQIADRDCYYPTNVGMPEFLSPEHINAQTFDFEHKKSDDVWILQQLLFRILTPNGSPYFGNTDTAKAIAEGKYLFQGGEHPADPSIKGTVWHRIVGHLPSFLKVMFWNSFNGQGELFHETDRKSSLVWLNAMVRYQEDLPEMIKRDPERGKFIPDKPPIVANASPLAPDDDLKKILEYFSASGNGNASWNNINN